MAVYSSEEKGLDLSWTSIKLVHVGPDGTLRPGLKPAPVVRPLRWAPTKEEGQVCLNSRFCDCGDCQAGREDQG